MCFQLLLLSLFSSFHFCCCQGAHARRTNTDLKVHRTLTVQACACRRRIVMDMRGRRGIRLAFHTSLGVVSMPCVQPYRAGPCMVTRSPGCNSMWMHRRTPVCSPAHCLNSVHHTTPQHTPSTPKASQPSYTRVGTKQRWTRRVVLEPRTEHDWMHKGQRCDAVFKPASRHVHTPRKEMRQHRLSRTCTELVTSFYGGTPASLTWPSQRVDEYPHRVDTSSRWLDQTQAFRQHDLHPVLADARPPAASAASAMQAHPRQTS